MSIKHKGGSASLHGKSSTLSQPALHPLRRNRASGLDESITSLGSVDVKNLAGTEHKASAATLEIMGRAKERHDAYGSIQIKDMFERNPKAQFDGGVARYRLPDTRPHLHKIHGQTSWKLNQTSKTTIIDEIFKDAKHPQR